MQEDPWRLLSAWCGLLPAEAVFAGTSAAWLWGLDLAPADPVEVIVPAGSGIRSRAGLRVRHCDISPTEVASVKGLRATSVHRTLVDLCTWSPEVEALVALDMAVRLSLTSAASLTRYAAAAKGRAGAYRLRRLAAVAAAAESPMETRLRWLLIQAGLPHPEVQTNLRDREHRFVGRADLY